MPSVVPGRKPISLVNLFSWAGSSMKSTNAAPRSLFWDSWNCTRWLPPANAVPLPDGPAGVSTVPIFFSSSGLVAMIEL